MENPIFRPRIVFLPIGIFMLALSSCASVDDSYMQGAGLKIPKPGPSKPRPWEKKDEWKMPFPKPEFLDAWEETWNDR